MFPFARGIFEDKVANFWVRLLFLLSSLSKAPAVFLRRSTPLVMELTASSSFVFLVLPSGLLSVRDQRSRQVASSRALVVPSSSRAGSHRPRPPPFVLLRPPSRTRLTQWRFWRSRGTRRSGGGDCRQVGRACELELLFVRFSGSRECVSAPPPSHSHPPFSLSSFLYPFARLRPSSLISFGFSACVVCRSENDRGYPPPFARVDDGPRCAFQRPLAGADSVGGAEPDCRHVQVCPL